MEVEVISVYKGQDVRKTVLVWGNMGSMCRMDIPSFKVGQYYVIAFLNANKFAGGHPCEKDTDYSISNCGGYSLAVDLMKNMAIGDIDKNDRTKGTINLNSLRNEVGKNGY